MKTIALIKVPVTMINDHWRMTNEWWIKFGQMTETIPPEAGIDCSLLGELHKAGYGQ